MGYVVHRDGAFAAEKIQRSVARRREQKRLGVTDRAGGVGTQEPGVSILHDVVLILQRRKPSVQIRAQRGFIRLHFLRKPLRMRDGGRNLIGKGQTHGGNRRRARGYNRVLLAAQALIRNPPLSVARSGEAGWIEAPIRMSPCSPEQGYTNR